MSSWRAIASVQFPLILATVNPGVATMIDLFSHTLQIILYQNNTHVHDPQSPTGKPVEKDCVCPLSAR